MALKSSREGLRKELVDYLGNLIIDDNLKNEIIELIGANFVTNDSLNNTVNSLETQITTESSERVNADTILQNNINAEALARESADTNLSGIKANKSDVLSLEEIRASTDLTGKIASASSVNELDSRISSYVIGFHTSKTIHFSGFSAIVCISRVEESVYSIYLVDYWSSGAQLIGGSSANVTLTKEVGSNDVTISNNKGVSISVIVIS